MSFVMQFHLNAIYFVSVCGCVVECILTHKHDKKTIEYSIK